MFNIEDKNTIREIIDQRSETDIVIPLYVKVGNTIYSLLEANTIPDCSRSIFKVGFGSSASVFTRNSFPTNQIVNFSGTSMFMNYDEQYQANVRYFIFESDEVDVERNDSANGILNKQINDYYNMLFDYVMEFVNVAKTERRRKAVEDYA